MTNDPDAALRQSRVAQREDLSSLRIDRDQMDSAVRRRRVWIPILMLLIALIAVLLVLRGGFGAPALETLTIPPPARPQKDVVMTATGYVVARRTAAVGPKIAGRLASLGVEEGTAVRKGQIIGRLESSDLAANVLQAEARVLSARADLAQSQAEQIEKERERSRLGRLLAEGVAPKADFEGADAAAEAGLARTRGMEERIRAEEASASYARAILANASVVAPFDGVVLTKDAEVGESVAPAVGGGGTTRGSMVTMADMDSIEVEADVSESNIAKLTVGMPAEIVLDAFPDRPYAAVLHKIVPTADRQKATVEVKVRFTGDRSGALPQMSARVNFLTPQAVIREGPRNVITLPASAVRAKGEGWVVYEVERGVAKEVPVVLASAPKDSQAEVVSGLQGGEEILLSPPADLEPSSKVKIKETGKK